MHVLPLVCVVYARFSLSLCLSLAPYFSFSHLPPDVDGSGSECLSQCPGVDAEVPRRRVQRLRPGLVHLYGPTSPLFD